MGLATQIYSVENTVIEGTRVGQVIDNIDSKLKDRIIKHLGIDKVSFKEKWLSGENNTQFIEEVQEAINVSVMTSMYEKSAIKYGSFKLLTKFINSFDNFLRDDSKVLKLYTKSTFFSTVKVFQYLNMKEDYTAKNGLIFFKLEDSEIIGHAEKAFRSEIHNLMIVECAHTFKEQNSEDFYERFSDIIKSRSDKKIILIINQDKRNNLGEKFRPHLMYEDEIDLKEFEPEENPLDKKIIIFQGQKEKLSLTTLTGVENWDDFIDYLSNSGIQRNEAVDIIFKLLKSNEIIIGSKPLGINSLEGAYAKLHEEINTETLANKLIPPEFKLDNNSDFGFLTFIEATKENLIYIISGLSALNREAKAKELLKYLGIDNQTDSIHYIECQIGEIGSESKIQIVDNQFDDEKFREICLTYPEKQIFWISAKNTEKKPKFILQQLYNPEFYLKRKFKKIIIKKGIKDLLTDDNLSNIFIFQYVNYQREIINWLTIKDRKEKDEFEKKCKKSKIKFFNFETDAKAAFEEDCSRNETVHWLKIEHEKLIWCHSHGSLRNLRKYIDYEQSEEVEEAKLIEKIKNETVVIIADDPGMGKTTTSRKLFESKAKRKPFVETDWVISINLKSNLQAIKDIEVENGRLDIFSVVNFLSKVDLNLDHNLAKQLLVLALDKKQTLSKPLLLVFDGFDEILDEKYREKIILLLKFLKNETAVKIWITTRMNYKETLEDELFTFANEFIPLSNEDKIAYIKKYLKDRLYLILDERKFNEIFDNNDEMQQSKIIVKYAGAFLNKMDFIFKDNKSKFIGTPLHLYLILDTSINYLKNLIENKDISPDFSYLGNDVWEVYENFIDRKYDVYFKKIDFKEPLWQRQEKLMFEQYHKDLAKSKILNLRLKNSLEEFKAIVLSTGIIISQGDNMEFTHSTFKEFYAAKIFLKWIKKYPNGLFNSNKLEFLLTDILLKPDYEMVRTFLNAALGKITDTEMQDGSLKQLGETAIKLIQKKLGTLIYEGKTSLHIAVQESNTNIVRILLYSLKYHKNILKNCLFALSVYEGSDLYVIDASHKRYRRCNMESSSDVGKSALHLAFKTDNAEIVRMLLDAAERISKKTLQKCLYSFSSQKTNAFDEAVMNCNDAEILKELLKRAKNKMKLIVHENKKYNSFCLACKHEKDDFVQILFRIFEHDEHSLKQLFACNDINGNALYWARNSRTIVENLLDIAKSMNDNNETLKNLLIPQNTSRHPLEGGYNSDVVKILINVAKDLNDNNHTLKKFLLPEKCSESLLQYAIYRRYIDVVKILLNTAKDINDDYHTLRQLLLPKNGNLPLIEAINWKYKDIVELLLNFAKGLNDDNETLKKILLPESDSQPMIEAFYCKNFDIFLMVWNATQDCNDNNDTFKKVLLSAFDSDNFIFDMGEFCLNNSEDINADYDTLKEILLPQQIPSHLHFAIQSGNINKVEILLNIAKGAEDNNSTLIKLLFNDEAHEAPLFGAARGGHCEIIKLLLKTAANLDSRILEKLVCAHNKFGENAILLMISNGYEELIEDSFRILEEATYKNIKKKVDEMRREALLKVEFSG